MVLNRVRAKLNTFDEIEWQMEISVILTSLSENMSIVGKFMSSHRL